MDANTRQRIEVVIDPCFRTDENQAVQATVRELLAEHDLLESAFAAARAENKKLSGALAYKHGQLEEARKIVQRAHRLNEVTGNDTWAWLGDGGDDLDSMSSDMIVVITAGDLRSIALRARPDDGKVERDDTNRLDWLLSFASVEDVGDEHVVPGVAFRIDDAENQLLGPSLEWTPRQFIDAALARAALTAADRKDP